MPESKIFFTSDLHFFHNNIINYCNRPWANVHLMKEGLIQNWNQTVSEKDLVYILGDFAMGGRSKKEEACQILERLKGRKRFICGNHDSYIVKEPCLKHFEWVRYYYEVKYTSPTWGKKKFVLSHYPMLSWNGGGRKDAKGNPYSIMLHGHSHGNLDYLNQKTSRMDVGVDSNNYCPVWAEDIIKTMNGRIYRPVDHHDENTNYREL